MSSSRHPRRVRPRSSRSTRPADPLAPDRIEAALGLLARLEPASLITLRPERSGDLVVAVADLPPDPRCAGAGLFCLDAPAPCSLVGLSFTGDPAPPDGDGPVRVDAVVTTSGQVHSQIHRPGREPSPVTGAAGGVVVDALHRVLGLPAPGEAPPLIAMVIGLWLHQVLPLTAGGRRPSWAEVAAAHFGPAHGPDAGPGIGGPGCPPPSEEVVAESMQELADEADWEDLRRAAAIGRMAAPELAPEEAGWMDTTMFARWMVDSFPSPDAVLTRLTDAGAHDVADRVRDVLERLRTG